MQQDDLIQGRYRLQHPLGKGGMAEVWCAHDERLERPVAIKFLAAQFHDDPEFLVRFFSEAQLVARISHPHVTKILDFGEHQERPYLVMEYVDGGAVTELAGEPMLPERAAEIVSQAAWGAGATHLEGMVHRDIKPGNILLTDRGDAKLADFGIASSTSGEQLTATGQAIGSPHYVSPEQASGRSCSPRSDVYSLGVVLYELLTGRPPFDGDNVTAIAIAHVESAPTPPSVHVPDLDPDLEAIVMRCLEKDPAERFEDGRALGAALEEPAAAAAFLPPDTELGYDYDEEAGGGGRVLATILIALLVLGLVAVGVLAGGGDSTEPREMSYDQETENQGKKSARRRPSPSPTTDTQTATASVAAATPAPSPTPRSEKKVSTGATGSDTSGGSEDTTEPTPEPTSEPTTEPTTEPTAEPSPAPTTTSE